MKKNNNSKGNINEESNFLMYVPVIIHENYKVSDNNIVTLYFEHNKLVEKFARWLVKKSNISDIELDERCSHAWLLIDGEKNIYEIAVKMAEMYGDPKEVAIERLVHFIRYILKKNWIKFKSIKSQ